ncbi:aldo/keto reductase [Streptomyces sp. NPDC057690]|uniref:aldo/keto reductase n=1 Tax=Streptomyces sp. NPDC057690 TaxID=3346214 RepID=UPI00369E1EFE
MQSTTLGANGPEVGVIGLGCMGMTYAYDLDTPRDEDQMIGLIRQAVDAGATLVDTADAYGPYTNEQLVGQALNAEYRSKAVLATKVGIVGKDEGRNIGPIWVNASPEHIRDSIDGSLKRLNTDHVDLYQLHRVDPAVPLEESWGAMASVVTSGKASRIGLSHVTLDEIKRAQSIHPVSSVQSELSLRTRDQLAEVLPYCEANGIAFIAYSPMGNGILTGRFASRDDLPTSDVRRLMPKFDDSGFTQAQALVSAVRSVAERHNATPAQVALAWVVAQGRSVVPIPGTKTPKYLAQNLAAADLTLTPQDLTDLDV